MDQSKSSDQTSSTSSTIAKVPKRSFSVEFFVGVFTFIGVLALGFLSVGLGGFELSDAGTYQVTAEFDNVAGLQVGAAVELAGVPLGTVSQILLADPSAKVIMKLDNSFRVRTDDIFSIRTKGIIGDRYVKISRGASDDLIPLEGGKIMDTESVIDIEDIIGKIVHSMTKDEEEEEPDA